MDTRKHKTKPEDYVKASAIVDTLEPGEQDKCHVVNIKAFRKYISDLSSKGTERRKKFTTEFEPAMKDAINGIVTVWRLY